MKGFLYCFKVLGTKDSNDSQLLKNIYKIFATVRNTTEVMEDLKNSKEPQEIKFYTEVDNIYKLNIFEKLYNYKYGKEENYYKVEFSKIVYFGKKDLEDMKLRNEKSFNVNKFVENLLQEPVDLGVPKSLEASLPETPKSLERKVWNKVFINSILKKNFVYEDTQNIKIGELYQIYVKWFRNSKVYISKEKAEICEFLEFCEDTCLGKTNEWYEWTF
jgi:hypothetical protein